MKKLKNKSIVGIIVTTLFMLIVAPVIFAGCSLFDGLGDSGTIKISTPEEFMAMEYSSQKQKTYQLANDLDFNGIVYENKSMVSGEKFTNVLDGKGYTIKNITAIGEYASLLGIIHNGAIVKDLKLENVSFTGGNYCAGIAGGYTALSTGVELNNIEIKSGVIGSPYSMYVGGILGSDTVSWSFTGLSIENCKNYATINGKHCVGGIAGVAYNPTIKNCENHGNIVDSEGVVTSESSIVNIGGIAGFVAIHSDGFVIKECINTGNVSSANLDYAGGIVGRIGASKGELSDCENNGEISCKTYAGGITGGFKEDAISSVIIGGNTNFGKIIAESTAGGIIGFACKNSALRINNNGLAGENNYGYVCAENYAGGIAGQASEATIERSTNNGEVGSTTIGQFHGSCNVGGIVGKTFNTTINGCINWGNLNGTGVIGGIVGTVEATVNVSIKENSNSGDITSDSRNHKSTVGFVNLGGIIGKLQWWGTNVKKIDLTYSANYGDFFVTHEQGYIGGIVGHASHKKEPALTVEQMNSILEMNSFTTRCNVQKTKCDTCSPYLQCKAVFGGFPGNTEITSNMATLNNQKSGLLDVEEITQQITE